MKVLGVSTSPRKEGNTDILVTQVLYGAESAGAETRFIRPADLELKPCNGCMACVFKRRDCVIKDRFNEFLDALRWADAVVIGTPTYILSSNSVMKNILDRLVVFGLTRELAGKSAMAVATAGVIGWEPFALEQPMTAILAAGMAPVDRFVGYGQGPGEILYDDAAMDRAYDGGVALAKGEKNFIGDKGGCPICRLNMVTYRGGKGYCPLCDISGEVDSVEGVATIIPDADSENRWSEASMKYHYEEKILPSGPWFRENFREIHSAVKEFFSEKKGVPQ
ncbi:MAG: hypothetical protein C0608_04850 [Deltaproteobacteria bacterium]|nr:MAG: hypothetical protein C0608_04850 [Deltaproteobacteria bacterium]